MPPSPLSRLRKIALALPGATEVQAWGEATFRANNKLFAMFASGGTHHSDVDSVWIKSTPVNQGFIIASNPKRYFSPPYVGPSGWVGVKLVGRVNWKELAVLLRDAYDLTAVKKKTVRKQARQRFARGTARARPQNTSGR